MQNIISPREMKKIDLISYNLWREFVQPHVKRSRKKTTAMRSLFEAGPLPRCTDPVVKSIIKDGRGMDGLNAAMMTWSYLASMCRYHESKLQPQ